MNVLFVCTANGGRSVMAPSATSPGSSPTPGTSPSSACARSETTSTAASTSSWPSSTVQVQAGSLAAAALGDVSAVQLARLVIGNSYRL